MLEAPLPVVDGIEIDLREYPHVQAHVVDLWGSAECKAYLLALLTNTDRVGAGVPQIERRVRAGFPESFLHRLLNLVEVHDRLFPVDGPLSTDSGFVDWFESVRQGEA